MVKLVLAYSGGLDTSVALHWLLNKGYEVATYTADLGQEQDFKETLKRARSIGASVAIAEDLKEEFVTDYVFPAIKANAKYERLYLLGTSLARPLTAKGQVEYAKRIGATALSHGATGKGNDQVRFELAYRYLYPEAEIIAPWKMPEFFERFQGRDDMIEYAQQHEIPVKATHSKPYSSDDNLMHISHEAGILEDPQTRPPEDMFQLTVSPKAAPDEETVLDIYFENGRPVKVVGQNNRIKASSPVHIMEYLNVVAGANGVGRLDMVEDRYVGMKSRGVYETPAGTVLHIAHRDLEGITMDKEVMKIRDTLSDVFAERVYSGYWFSPEMDYLRQIMDASQDYVTGVVSVALYKGTATVIGRSSPLSLYNPGIASMHEAGRYDPTNARGFIDVNAVRLQADARRRERS